MKNLLFTIALLIILPWASISQHSFMYSYNCPTINIPRNCIETNNGDIIFTTFFSDTGKSGTNFFKLQPDGTLITNKTITGLENVGFSQIVRNSDTSFLALGSFKYDANNYKYKFVAANITNNLELISLKTYFSSDLSYDYYNVITNHKGNFVFFAETFTGFYMKSVDKAIIYELSITGDSIQALEIESVGLGDTYGICPKSNNEGYYVFGAFNGFDLSTYVIVELDNNFEILKIHNKPLLFGFVSWINVIPFKKNLFLHTDTKHELFTESNGKSGTISIIDTNFNSLYEQSITRNEIDTFVNFSRQSNIDFIDHNNIFVSGFEYKSLYNYPFEETPSSIIICNMDSNLNKRWEKTYGGDCFYFPHSMCATQDGGCLVLGFRWDYNSHTTNNNDIFALKVDSLGTLVNTTIIELPQAVCSAFPNPGNDFMQLDIPEKHHPVRLEMFDVTGEKVITEELYDSQNRINTTHLLTGTYIYVVYTKENMVLKGKWVKE